MLNKAESAERTEPLRGGGRTGKRRRGENGGGGSLLNLYNPCNDLLSSKNVLFTCMPANPNLSVEVKTYTNTPTILDNYTSEVQQCWGEVQFGNGEKQ